MAWGFLHLALVWPNDRRVNFKFPDLRQGPAPRAVAFDFIGQAAFARASSNAPESARLLLQEHPWVNASRSFNRSPHVVQVGLGWHPLKWVRRQALYAPSSSTFEYSLAVPVGAVLTFHYGLLSPSELWESAGARFIVEVVAEDGRANPVFTQDLVPGKRFPFNPRGWFYRRFLRPLDVEVKDRESRWHPVSLELKAYEGKRVRLRFRTEPLPGLSISEKPVYAHAFWAEPVLWMPRDPRARTAENLILVVTESLRWDEMGLHGSPGRLTPHLDRLAREGVDFYWAYTNSVSPRTALPILLSSRRIPQLDPAVTSRDPARLDKEKFYQKNLPSLVASLKARGYRTAAVGALDGHVDGLGPGVDWGFDEVHVFRQPGYETVHSVQQALDWLAEHGGEGPFFLMVYLPDNVGKVAAPLRFWSRSLTGVPVSSPQRIRWGYRAQLAYMDEYLGRLFGMLDALQLWDRSLTAVVSARGSAFRPRPVRFASGRAAWRVPSAPGLSLTEEEVRVVWLMRHRRLPVGAAFQTPTQLVDVAPTLLNLLGAPAPQGFLGTAQNFASSVKLPDQDMPKILIHAEGRKALLVDGHFKYVRHQRPLELRLPGLFPFRRKATFQTGAEELYDLWADPAEENNLIAHKRQLLARVRRSMDELDPDPVETRLIFWDKQNAVAQGSVRLPAGEFRSFTASGSFVRVGPYQYNFTIQSSSGEVRFEAWPPFVPYVVQVRLDQRVVPIEQIRVSKLGLPLVERRGVEWFDHTSYSWMEGIAVPLEEEKGPLLFLGRVPLAHASGPVEENLPSVENMPLREEQPQAPVAETPPDGAQEVSVENP